MISLKQPYQFQSGNSEGFKSYLYEKSLSVSRRTLEGERCYCEALDRHLAGMGPDRQKLTERNLMGWLERKPGEKKITQKKRLDFTKRFCRHVQKTDAAVEVPSLVIRNAQTEYVPYIFTVDEMRRIFDAADRYQPTRRSPYLGITVPTAFRILYGCGLRSHELVSLKLGDVDLDRRVLLIRDTKFGKSRYVPFSESLGIRLLDYISCRFLSPSPDAGLWLFASRDDNIPYTTQAVHKWLMNLLYAAGIRHGGRGIGPRVHDFRHTFAVHSIQNCFREKENLALILPLLSEYLGHKDLRGTQYYLRLTAEIYPDIQNALLEKYGVLTGGDGDDE